MLAASSAGLFVFDGEGWQPSSIRIGEISSSPRAIAISPHNPNNTVICLENSVFSGILYRSIDNEKSWKQVYGPGFEAVARKIVYHPIDSNLVYSLWSGSVMRSINGGDNWGDLHFYKSIRPVDMLITSHDKFLLDRWGEIYKSRQSDSLWDLVRTTTDSEHAVIRMDPNDEKVLYLGSFWLFKSSDAGNTWERMPFNKMIVDILIDSASGAIIVGTYDQGIWYSLNNGKFFRKLPDLPSERIQSMCWLLKDNKKYLAAGARGAGVYLLELSSVLSVNEVLEFPLKYSLLQNYPNPFNPMTTIAFELPKPSYVSLTVYDCLGRQIAIVIDGYRIAGHYEERFDASSLSSGVYFYRINAGSFLSAKKMLLLK
jgi:hypothetical protein